MTQADQHRRSRPQRSGIPGQDQAATACARPVHPGTGAALTARLRRPGAQQPAAPGAACVPGVPALPVAAAA